MREALNCLDFLDSHLEYEEWVMEHVEAAQDAQDDEDDDDDVDVESEDEGYNSDDCLLYTSPSPRDATLSRMPSSA